MRHQHEGGADAVVIHVAHVAADQVEEAMQLALGVMETPGARPAVGAAEDRPVAEIALHAAELARHQVEGLVPRYFDEGLGAAPLREGARTLLEPAPAHGGTAHAQARHLVGQHVQADRRGIGILREGMQTGGLAGLVVFDFVDAPVGHGERALMSHGTARPRGRGASTLTAFVGLNRSYGYGILRFLISAGSGGIVSPRDLGGSAARARSAAAGS